MTSTELARQTGNSLTDRMAYARALASAGLLPRAYRDNPGNVLLAMELGDALGIRTIQAIQGIHVIEGKPSASADLIASLVRRAGHRLRISGDDTTATAVIIRADDPDFTFTCTWTIDRARVAGLLGKGVWQSYPASMLKARAITEVARAGASDALYGVIYTPEELNADEDGRPDRDHRAELEPSSVPVEVPADVVDAEVVTDDAPAPTPVAEPVAAVAEGPGDLVGVFLDRLEMCQNVSDYREAWTYAGKAGIRATEVDDVVHGRLAIGKLIMLRQAAQTPPGPDSDHGTAAAGDRDPSPSSPAAEREPQPAENPW